VKNIFLTIITVISGLALADVSNAATPTVPEPFRGFDANSKYTISYEDLTAALDTVVVDTGRSTREVAAPSSSQIGTRMKVSVKRSTVNEANRFYYEIFKNDQEARQLLLGIQKSLEQIPNEAPLEYFSRDEQLAYWLNLYNVTILNEIIKIYPKRDLKKVVTGKKSILDKKILKVAGIPLSLNDIQYTILKKNYNDDPLIIYGLYQGYIGGPNIRKRAYTGNSVYRALKNNAIEFINSNRGTDSSDEKVFQVSSLYDRNRVYFPDFNSDLTAHLKVYLEGRELTDLQSATKLKANINDWTVTDLGGSKRDLSATSSSNSAALLSSVKATTQGVSGAPSAAPAGTGFAGTGTSDLATKDRSRIDQGLLRKLQAISAEREQENNQNATVTIEELGQVPVEPEPDPEKKDND
jgi:hypothetical protein